MIIFYLLQRFHTILCITLCHLHTVVFMCYLYDIMKCFVRNDEIKLWNHIFTSLVLCLEMWHGAFLNFPVIPTALRHRSSVNQQQVWHSTIALVPPTRCFSFIILGGSVFLQWSLQWRHNELDGVSNHQPHYCLLNRFFKAQIKEKIKAPRHWPLCGEFTDGRWIPHTRASNAGNIHSENKVVRWRF